MNFGQGVEPCGERPAWFAFEQAVSARVNGAEQVIFPGGDGVLYGFEPATGGISRNLIQISGELAGPISNLGRVRRWWILREGNQPGGMDGRGTCSSWRRCAMELSDGVRFWIYSRGSAMWPVSERNSLRWSRLPPNVHGSFRRVLEIRRIGSIMIFNSGALSL